MLSWRACGSSTDSGTATLAGEGFCLTVGRGVPHLLVLVLAGQRSGNGRTDRRGRAPFRAAARAPERRRTLQRGIRSFQARNSFVQYYGGKGLDASLLLIPISGFLPPQDPRVLGTIDAIQREICSGPFVWRYSTDEEIDGLAGSEGAFLICSFWLVSALALAGRIKEAERNLEQLRALQNDVGLFSEEYDPVGRRLLGNFPQAFSHIGLLHSIFTISEVNRPL
jgi:GH15 family glucan-1,4-alpha-glucosidase